MDIQLVLGYLMSLIPYTDLKLGVLTKIINHIQGQDYGCVINLSLPR